jgi:Big-like domain-containing protein/invasin-like protein
MNYRVVASILLVVSLLPALGCDKATPVAPNNSILTISANPTKIGLNGRSTITVVGRKPDGQPLNPGTEVRLSVDKGTINPAIVAVDDRGEGTATFRADGRSGIAKITATTGGGQTMVTTDVQVGESSETKPTVLLSVNPNTIAVQGTATVNVIGRNADGSPAAGQQVLLTTTLGTLGRERLTLDNSGTVSTTLTAGAQAGTAKVTAVLGSSDAVTVDVVIRSAILELTASQTSVPEDATTTISLFATVTDFAGTPIQGRTVTFRADRGILSSPTAQTNAQGLATVTLEIDAEEVTSNQTFQVTATTPSGAGDPLSATITITIRNDNP